MPTIRHEINILDGTLSGSAAANGNAIVQLDTTQYNGTVTYYFEVVMSGAASNTGTVKLRRSGTTTDDASITGPTNATMQRLRSSSFTPPAGQTAYIVRNNADGVRSQTIKSARIIIIQTCNTIVNSETQIEIGNQETGKNNTVAAALANPKYWYYDSTKWAGTNTFYAEVTYLTSSTQTFTCKLQEDDGAFGSWADKVTIVNAVSNTAATRTRSASFVPTSGRNYRITVLESSATSGKTYAVYNAKIIVDQALTPRTKALSAGENNCYALTVDDNYVYGGMNTSPGIIVRVLRSDMSTETSKTLAVGENQPLCACNDEQYIYYGCTGSPGKVIRIQKNNFNTYSTLTLNAGSNNIRGICVDKTYIYCACDTSPSTFVRILKSDFSTQNATSASAGNDFARAIGQDDTYVYLTGINSPAHIGRIDKATWSSVSDKTLSAGWNSGFSMAVDANYVYVGCQSTSPAKITRLLKSDFTTLTDLTLNSGSNEGLGLAVDSKYLYVANWTNPAILAMVRVSDFVHEVSYSIAAQNTGISLALSNNKIYIGEDQGPAHISEVDLAAISKMEEQYLLSNTLLAAGTALQTFLSSWDPTEWNISNVYIHEVQAASGSTSVVEADTAGGTQITASSVSSPANRKQSSPLTMPAAGDIDMKATTNGGDVNASRILVQVGSDLVQKLVNVRQAINRSLTY